MPLKLSLLNSYRATVRMPNVWSALGQYFRVDKPLSHSGCINHADVVI